MSIVPDLSAEKAFEAFGRVMAKVGALEQYMRVALLEHEQRRRFRSSNKDQPDPMIFVKKVLRMDFGQLHQQVYQQFKLKPEFLAVMKEVKSFRDHLAHEFWVAHFGSLRSPRGRAIIIQQCTLYERQFDRVGKALIGETALDATQYVSFLDQQAGNEAAFEGWEERLAVAYAAEAKAQLG